MRSVLIVLSLMASVARADEVKAGKDEARLLRFPAINDKSIVFTHGGDLYTVPSEGGVARRMTNHDGFEMFPRFSPDGKWVAFTGQYDGNTEVYLMPSEGGTPKRLTYTATLGRDDVSDRMGPNNIVVGWKNDGKHIIFRSRMRSFNDFIGQLYTVSIDGGLPEQLPVPRGGFASFSPDDKKMVYNRVFREFRTWKRYRGGMADDLWVYDFETKKVEPLLTNEAQDIIPMWHGDKVYFVSDRDDLKRMNLYVHDLKDKSTRAVTTFKDFDVKFPSLGKDAIVLENGGWIYRLDLPGEKLTRVSIRILDDGSGSRPSLVDVSKNVTNYEIAPDGKRALFGARGDVFTVPAQNGPTRNLTQSPGIHERNSKWSPDGKWIAYISDEGGEDEIWIAPQDGKDKPQRVTSGNDVYLYDLLWSPDSKKIAFVDRKQRLRYVEVATKKITDVTQAKAWEIRDYTWAPDSRWLAYVLPEVEGMQTVQLYSLESKLSTPVSDNWFSAAQPAFSGDGKYLFFVSERDFNPTYSRTEWNHSYQDLARIYFVTLAKDTPSPFKPKSDETGAGEEKPKKDDPKPADKKDDKPAEKKEATPLKVELDGIKDRLLRLPVTPANYRNLQSVGGTLYYIRHGSKDPRPALQMYDVAGQKETALGAANGYEISADGKKMIVSDVNKYAIIDLPKATINVEKSLDLSAMQVTLDRKAEWKQIFDESWRQMRDFFYDPGMHGVDWKAMRERYAPMVAHVGHRADLTYVIGEMIAELNAGHAYVGGGEMPKPRRLTLGLLGAEFERDSSGAFKIAKILKGANWDPRLRSPLTEVGIDVKPGEYLLAIDGKPAREMKTPFEALVDKSGKQVTLRIGKSPDDKDGRDVVVTPIADEGDLYYYRWVQDNIKKVSDATGGKVGYIHVPDMQQTGLNEFAKHFYPQLAKKALVIDVRGNGGGNVSPMLIERLRRELVQITVARNAAPRLHPYDAIHGPKVCLMNEFSASDGDLFPFQFRQYKLGKLIGKRSWGGVVGIRGTLPLLDGGILNKPEFSRFDVEGKEWIIEGVGVTPDIVVDNEPAKEYAGEDQQLDRAIAHVLEELKEHERKIPNLPPFPKR